jgi:hypothetical protein
MLRIPQHRGRTDKLRLLLLIELFRLFGRGLAARKAEAPGDYPGAFVISRSRNQTMPS